MKNQLINLFALIGFVTFIVLACSVASDDDEPINPNPQTTDTNDYGKYQVSDISSSNIVVLNTETGVMKSYVYSGGSNGNWSEFGVPVTFTH